ncbi:unnamed protein product [Vitrella brassicaformis CCMP3155]|uniref:Uncharacterized protein n=1 Tax=Vitrella brassicaformis (strain CCMP3155) TaxID=1169540 RepID=A0A0G4GTV4_VITBC|nr:unnamed protein product [Vitrella brassicaformis CCMP3155]|eukprot:CEM34177.1 unnamed protein product [Vitrella brassicaformis CCMP3155]
MDGTDAPRVMSDEDLTSSKRSSNAFRPQHSTEDSPAPRKLPHVLLSPLKAQGSQDFDKKSVRSKGDDSASRTGISSLKQSLAIALGDKAAEGYLSVPLRREAFIQRLTMEENMSQQECACLFFSFIFLLFMIAVYVSSGTDHVYRVHESLREAFHLDDLDDVRTVDSVWGFIANLSKTESEYIPSSSQFFIHDATTELNALPTSAFFPPSRNLQNYPLELFKTFTMTAWVKTTSPQFTVIEKRLDRDIAGLGSTCWRIGVDCVTYGAHEGRLFGTFVTDVAQDLLMKAWAPARTTSFSRGIDDSSCPRGKDPDFTQTRESMKAEAEAEAQLNDLSGSTLDNATVVDGEWHLYAVIVRNTTASFLADGGLIESLPNPTHQRTICPGRRTVPVYHQTLTDCAEGSFYVGDDQFSGHLADVRIFPRELTKSEIQDIITFGAPLDDLINAGGASATDTINLAQQRLDKLEDTVTASLDQKQETYLKSIKTLRNDLVGNPFAASAGGNGSVRLLTPLDTRSLQGSALTENDTARFLELMDSCYDNPSYHDFSKRTRKRERGQRDAGAARATWYRTNDKSCSLYVDNVTVGQCPISYSQCALQFMSIAWDIFDIDDDFFWNFTEMKAFMEPIDPTFDEYSFAFIRLALDVSTNKIPFEAVQTPHELLDLWLDA